MVGFKKTLDARPLHHCAVVQFCYLKSILPNSLLLQWTVATVFCKRNILCILFVARLCYKFLLLNPSNDRGLQSLCGTSQCVVNIKLVQLTVNHTQNKTLVTVLFEQQ